MRDGFYKGFMTTTVEMCNVGTTVLFAVQTALELAQNLTPVGADHVSAGPQRSRLARQPENMTVGGEGRVNSVFWS